MEKKNRLLKKIFIILLSFMDIWMLTGCNSMLSVNENTDVEEQMAEDSEEQTDDLTEGKMTEDIEWFSAPEEIAALELPEDMLAYWMVLNNKKAFVSMNEDGQKFYLNEYFWYLDDVESEYHVNYFMIVDMDGDGLEEVVLECSPGTSQVLHYEDGEVYSYQFGIRAMKRIHINGIYDASGGAANNYYLRLTNLNKDGYTEEMIARMDDDYYEVEGEETTQEEWFAYVESIESVELAEKMEFTEDVLDQQLLGDLSEQEIVLVKGIPAENIIENESDYQEYKLTLQLYAKVLTGEEDVIYVTRDTFWEDTLGEELSWVYFSIVDMDGDGVQELVFSCYFDVIRIWHYEGGQVYGYQFRTFKCDTPIVTTDGIFQTDDLSSTGYARIVSLDKNGYEIEPVEDYGNGNHERIRYYFFSEESINQWLK